MVKIKEVRELDEFPEKRGPYKYAEIYKEIDSAPMYVPSEINIGDASIANVRAICSRYYGPERAEKNGFKLRTRSYVRDGDRHLAYIKLDVGGGV